MNEELKTKLIASALQRANRMGWFSICPFNDIRLVRADKDAYETLRGFHCEDWPDIPFRSREIIPELVEAAYGIRLPDELRKPRLLTWERIKLWFGVQPK